MNSAGRLAEQDDESTPYRGFRFSKPIIQHAVWVARVGPQIARHLRRQRGQPSDTWYLDEVFVRIRGRRMYLWRAVDAEGRILDARCRAFGTSAQRSA
jgi:transposase-like protein